MRYLLLALLLSGCDKLTTEEILQLNSDCAFLATECVMSYRIEYDHPPRCIMFHGSVAKPFTVVRQDDILLFRKTCSYE